MPTKAYAMDLENSFMALSVSGNQVITYDLKIINQRKHMQLTGWLGRLCKWQQHFCQIGGIEWKCEILNITNAVNKMVFRCHRV